MLLKAEKTIVLISVHEIIIKQRHVVKACLQANTPLFLFPKFLTMAMAWLMNIKYILTLLPGLTSKKKS